MSHGADAHSDCLCCGKAEALRACLRSAEGDASRAERQNAALRARVAELEGEVIRLRAALDTNDPELVADYAAAIGHLEWDAPAVALVDALLTAIRERAGLEGTQQTTEPGPCCEGVRRVEQGTNRTLVGWWCPEHGHTRSPVAVCEPKEKP